MRKLMIFIVLALPPTAAFANPSADVATARASLVGKWEGSLEYLDYGANQWFGIPVKTSIEDQGDGATTIRKSVFDDGPKVGNVRITSVELFEDDKATVSVGAFRKGKTPALESYTVHMEGPMTDTTHWTMVEESVGEDDDRPAILRITTKRDGDCLEALKQVDFQDDDKAEWLSRNRLKLKARQ